MYYYIDLLIYMYTRTAKYLDIQLSKRTYNNDLSAKVFVILILGRSLIQKILII